MDNIIHQKLSRYIDNKTPYILVSGASIYDLEDHMEFILNCGYTPTGGVMMDTSKVVPMWYQAVYLKDAR
jgi:hypothetical protein